MLIRWTIVWVGEKETITKQDGTSLSKISFVVEENSDREYKDAVLLDMWGDRADEFASNYKEWDVVTATFGWRVRDYTNKEGVTRKICSLNGIRVELEWKSNTSKPKQEEEDLPF